MDLKGPKTLIRTPVNGNGTTTTTMTTTCLAAPRRVRYGSRLRATVFKKFFLVSHVRHHSRLLVRRCDVLVQQLMRSPATAWKKTRKHNSKIKKLVTSFVFKYSLCIITIVESVCVFR